MMHNLIRLKLNLFITLATGMAIAHGQVDRSDVASKLWDAIGGKENWQQARYFMFSCIGGETNSFVHGERKYLWDKETGNCRFEGTTTDDENVIVLFNIRTDKGSAYINGQKLDSPRIMGDVVKEASYQFARDAYLLFLPTAFEGNHASYKVSGDKLVGMQRFTIINIKNQQTSFKAEVDGQLYVDAQTGQVQKWTPTSTDNHFSISGFKDIGGGLVLPTRFEGSDTTTNVTYPLAAALVNIEDQKFRQP